MEARKAKKQREAARRARLSKKRVLTEDVIKRATTLRQHGDESKEHFFERVTSLSLQDKRLCRIENLHVCPKLRVLFLYDNSISKMENLSFARNLTHLSLENNCISKVEDLKDLRRLVKLRLDGNRIARLEGLAGCVDLQEVHLNDQTLDDGQRLQFEQESLDGVADSLCILGIRGTQCDDISPLQGLVNLHTIHAGDNDVAAMAQVEAVLESCSLLEHIELQGNPVAQRADYRDIVVANSELLQTIDDKPIKPNQRAFLQARNRRRKLEGQTPDDGGSGVGDLNVGADANPPTDALDALRISAGPAPADVLAPPAGLLGAATEADTGKPGQGPRTRNSRHPSRSSSRSRSRSRSPTKQDRQPTTEPSFSGLLNVGAVRLG